jgi:hypothetical protein
MDVSPQDDERSDRDALKKQIRDNHPNVYLTLVSIIVALALEDLFSLVREIYTAAEPQTITVLVRLQIQGAISAAFATWVGYCHIFITTRWILGIWDALSVMALLVTLFLINSFVGAENPVWWFCAMAVQSFAGGTILYVNMRRAQMEPDVIHDAMPAPNSWPVYHLMLGGGLLVIFALLVFSGVVGDLMVALFAATAVFFVVSWAFVWVHAWRKSVGIA